jgi:hypothetical protein
LCGWKKSCFTKVLNKGGKGSSPISSSNIPSWLKKRSSELTIQIVKLLSWQVIDKERTSTNKLRVLAMSNYC